MDFCQRRDRILEEGGLFVVSSQVSQLNCIPKLKVFPPLFSIGWESTIRRFLLFRGLYVLKIMVLVSLSQSNDTFRKVKYFKIFLSNLITL